MILGVDEENGTILENSMTTFQLSRAEKALFKEVLLILAADAMVTVEWLIATARKAKKVWRINFQTFVEHVEMLFIEKEIPRIGLTKVLRNAWSCVPWNFHLQQSRATLGWPIFFDLFSSFHILSSWLTWSTPSRLRLSLHSDRLFVVKSSRHYKPLRTFGEVLFFITFNSMFRYVTIITKKILLSERVFWWWIISKNQIRSKMSGFFLTKIYGTAFQMIVFEKQLS